MATGLMTGPFDQLDPGRVYFRRLAELEQLMMQPVSERPPLRSRLLRFAERVRAASGHELRRARRP